MYVIRLHKITKNITRVDQVVIIMLHKSEEKHNE